MRKEIIASLLVLAVVASAGVGFLLGATTKQPLCDIAPQGSILYVRITQGVAGVPATNATVEAFAVETCNAVDTTIDILD